MNRVGSMKFCRIIFKFRDMLGVCEHWMARVGRVRALSMSRHMSHAENESQ